MARISPEPEEVHAADATHPAAGAHELRDDSVEDLARALQAAKRAHCKYLAELRLGDVEPAEDWSVWYAEYLLGRR